MYYQKTNNDCGIAATRNLLSEVYESRHYEASSFDEPLDNFLSIQKGLEKYGVKSKGYEVDEKGLDEVKRPFIAQIKNEDNEHFVVVKKGKNILTILDSAIGRIRMSKKNFLTMSTLKVLEIKSKQEVKEPKIKFMMKNENFKLITLCALECLFLVAGLILMTFLSSLYYLLGGFFLSFLTSIYKRSYILKINGNIDRRFILPFYKRIKDDESYDRLVSIKNDYFSLFISFMTELQIMLVMIVVAALQDIFLFIGAAIVLLFTLVSVFYINPYLRKYEMNAEKVETQMRLAIKEDKRDEKMFALYHEEAKISKKYSYYYYVMRIIPCLVAILIMLVISIVQKDIKFETIVFNIGYLVILSFNLLKMIRVENRSDPMLSSIADLKTFKEIRFKDDGLMSEE